MFGGGGEGEGMSRKVREGGAEEGADRIVRVWEGGE
jgi:hypothetical protein